MKPSWGLSLEERLQRLTRVTADGCWEWIGCRFRTGYGKVGHEGKIRSAHRVSYELRVGPIPAGKEIDHLCRNRPCINPLHLEPVTRRENVRRGMGACGIHARQTHCKNGHEFTEANTYTVGGTRRKCRTCTNAAVARYIQRKRAAPLRWVEP